MSRRPHTGLTGRVRQGGNKKMPPLYLWRTRCYTVLPSIINPCPAIRMRDPGTPTIQAHVTKRLGRRLKHRPAVKPSFEQRLIAGNWWEDWLSQLTANLYETMVKCLIRLGFSEEAVYRQLATWSQKRDWPREQEALTLCRPDVGPVDPSSSQHSLCRRSG